MKLKMHPPTGTTVPAQTSESVSQDIELVHSKPTEKSYMVKLKIVFAVGGETKTFTRKFDKFP